MSNEAAQLTRIQGLETAVQKLEAIYADKAEQAKAAKQAVADAIVLLRRYANDPAQQEIDFDG